MYHEAILCWFESTAFLSLNYIDRLSKGPWGQDMNSTPHDPPLSDTWQRTLSHAKHRLRPWSCNCDTQSQTHMLEKYCTSDLCSPRTHRHPTTSTCQPGGLWVTTQRVYLLLFSTWYEDQRCVLKGNMLTEVRIDKSKEAEGWGNSCLQKQCTVLAQLTLQALIPRLGKQRRAPQACHSPFFPSDFVSTDGLPPRRKIVGMSTPRSLLVRLQAHHPPLTLWAKICNDS